MRSAFVISLVILTSACSFERGAGPTPQPQKSALSMCLATVCGTPIFVVDGKRLPNDGADLVPSDIETVEVFKGPAAIKLYGDDARHGVIVITSKQAAAKKIGG
ncbi:MAG: TonB-dependent receptor plug domain-containing protein [Gemmatimonadaceae bacterium]